MFVVVVFFIFLKKILIDEISIDYGTITQFNDVDDLENINLTRFISFVI